MINLLKRKAAFETIIKWIIASTGSPENLSQKREKLTQILKSHKYSQMSNFFLHKNQVYGLYILRIKFYTFEIHKTLYTINKKTLL